MVYSQRALARYELLWVSVVFGLLLLLGAGYYQRLTVESQRFAMQLQAQNFVQAARVVKAFWQLRAKPEGSVELNGFTYRTNSVGWPVDAHSGDEFLPGSRCERLLFSLIIAPLSDTVGHSRPQPLGAEERSSDKCRFYGRGASEDLYFDYNPANGRVSEVQRH